MMQGIPKRTQTVLSNVIYDKSGRVSYPGSAGMPCPPSSAPPSRKLRIESPPFVPLFCQYWFEGPHLCVFWPYLTVCDAPAELRDAPAEQESEGQHCPEEVKPKKKCQGCQIKKKNKMPTAVKRNKMPRPDERKGQDEQPNSEEGFIAQSDRAAGGPAKTGPCPGKGCVKAHAEAPCSSD